MAIKTRDELLGYWNSKIIQNSDQTITGQVMNVGGVDIIESMALEAEIVSGMVWKNEWVAGTYDQYDTVRDGAWTMVANTTTTERAAPQVVSGYEWTNQDPVSNRSENYAITSSTEYVINEARVFNSARIWVPEYTADYEVNVYVTVYTSDPDDGLRVRLADLVVIPGEWNEISLFSLIATAGQTVRMTLVITNTAGDTNTDAGNWTFDGTTSTQPATGIWNSSPNEQLQRINVTNADGLDKTAVLRTFVPGTLVKFTQNDDPNKFVTYQVDEINDDDGVRYSFFGSLLNIGVNGWPDIGALSNITGTVPTAQPTQFDYTTDYWLTNSPSWATVQSELYFDTTEQAGFENTAFGIDVQSAKVTKSDDWDILSYAGNTIISSGSGFSPYYEYEKLAATYTNNTNGYTAIVSLTDTIPTTGTYEVKFTWTWQYSTINNSAYFRMSSDGGLSYTTFSVECKDLTDQLPAFYSYPQEYTEGEVVAIRLQGAAEDNGQILTVLFADVVLQKVK